MPTETRKERKQRRFQELMEAGYDRFEAQQISLHANEDVPEVCPKCGKDDELDEGGGMVGETIIVCKRCSEVIWEDSEDAIRRVI